MVLSWPICVILLQAQTFMSEMLRVKNVACDHKGSQCLAGSIVGI